MVATGEFGGATARGVVTLGVDVDGLGGKLISGEDVDGRVDGKDVDRRVAIDYQGTTGKENAGDEQSDSETLHGGGLLNGVEMSPGEHSVLGCPPGYYRFLSTTHASASTRVHRRVLHENFCRACKQQLL
jgi:hypothetical protein